MICFPQKKKKDLEEWERTNVGLAGEYATSDWPGWIKHIGKRPEFAPIKTSNKEPIPNETRWLVWERDNFTCRHCGARTLLSVDHIIPESKGGTLDSENLQTLCRSCNSQKGNKMVDVPRRKKDS